MTNTYGTYLRLFSPCCLPPLLLRLLPLALQRPRVLQLFQLRLITQARSHACRGFLTQCQLTFELQPSWYPSDRSKIAYVITLLTDKARAWATAIWQKQGPDCSDFNLFSENMLRVFDQTFSGQEAARKLLNLRQGRNSVADYAISFRTLAADSGWNEPALISSFINGLSEALKDGLATVDCPHELEALISSAIRLDNRVRERQRARSPATFEAQTPSWQVTAPPTDCPEPMQVGRARLSQAERDRRRREKCCIYCGQPGHFRVSCPELLGKDHSRPAEGGL